MSESRFQGAPPPRSHPVPTYQVLRPQRDGPLDVSLLADTIFGVQTHYVLSDVSGEGCSLVCHCFEGNCAYADVPQEWTGFIPVWVYGANKKAILRLAPKEADVLARVLGVDVNWAGRRCRILPVNKGRGKEIEVALPDTQAGAVYLPAFDMMRTICLVLKCSRIPQQYPLPQTAKSPEVEGL